MLRRVRRAVSGLIEEGAGKTESWDFGPGESYEPTIQTEETEAAAGETELDEGTFNPQTRGDYTTEVVRASIRESGTHGLYRIPVWWLQATLADLEGRLEESKLLWQRTNVAARSFDDGNSVEGDPTYNRLFGEGGEQYPRTQGATLK